MAEYGQSSAQIMSDLRTVLHFTDDTAHNNLLLSWMNAAIRDIYRMNDRHELKHLNGSIITDDSDSYDPTAEIDASFGRIIDGTVRCSDDHIFPISKKMIDILDPDRTDTGNISHYCLINRKTLLFFPFGSSGDTVYFDWLEYPVKIDADTTEANMPYDPDMNDFIFDGALWRGMKADGKPDWYIQKKEYFTHLKEVLITSKTVRGGTCKTVPVDF